jgi:hypothetical protein
MTRIINQAPADWEPLTSARSAEIREVWGLTGARTQPLPAAAIAPVVVAAPVRHAPVSGATCPEHGVMWTCGCDGCEAALTAPYGVHDAEVSGGAR